MAALLVGGAFLTVEKVREKRAKKRAQRKHNEERYADLENETRRASERRQSSLGELSAPSSPKTTSTDPGGRRQSASGVNNPFRQRSMTETTYGTTEANTEEEHRRNSSESEREGGETIREVKERLRSASSTSSARPQSGMQQVRRQTTGEMLFGGEGSKD